MHGRGAGGAGAKCPGLGLLWDFLGFFRLHSLALEGIILLSSGFAGRELKQKYRLSAVVLKAPHKECPGRVVPSGAFSLLLKFASTALLHFLQDSFLGLAVQHGEEWAFFAVGKNEAIFCFAPFITSASAFYFYP